MTLPCNVPPVWDLEADVVALGSGIGGLSAAITAHELGASADRSSPYSCTALEGRRSLPRECSLTCIHVSLNGTIDRSTAFTRRDNFVARMETGAVMQSGISNARGMTHGWLAARHACGDASTLLEREVDRLGL